MIGQICMQNLKLHWSFTPKFGTLSRCAQSAGARFARAQFAGVQYAEAQFAAKNCLGPNLPGPNFQGLNLPRTGCPNLREEGEGWGSTWLGQNPKFCNKKLRAPLICRKPNCVWFVVEELSVTFESSCLLITSHTRTKGGKNFFMEFKNVIVKILGGNIMQF